MVTVGLLIGGPRSSSGGGKVRLMAGSWIIRTFGKVDSVLHLIVGDSRVPLEPDHKLDLCEGCEANVEWHARGSEDYITVLAEKT